MSSRRGFTLIELVVVMAVVGVILSLVVINAEKISPKYALRAAAREVGATIDLARGTAVGSGRYRWISYSIEAGTYQIWSQPWGEPPGNGPFGSVPVGGPRHLPRGVRFEFVDVHSKNAGGLGRSGSLTVQFDPLSIAGSHIVHLANEQGQQISVKYNALLGCCDYADGTVGFEAPPN